MENITAEEFLQNNLTISHFYNDEYGKMCCLSDEMQKAMIEFAKLHVESALKEANKKAIMTGYVDSGQTILNAYPLENIK
jgi:hypothetical protein